MSPIHAREIEKKTKLLREDYGGMMNLNDLCRELSISPNTARAWIREHSLEGVRTGRIIQYETDQVAKVIVDGRGMV